jgi:hypothetical protein
VLSQGSVGIREGREADRLQESSDEAAHKTGASNCECKPAGALAAVGDPGAWQERRVCDGSGDSCPDTRSAPTFTAPTALDSIAPASAPTSAPASAPTNAPTSTS